MKAADEDPLEGLLTGDNLDVTSQSYPVTPYRSESQSDGQASRSTASMDQIEAEVIGLLQQYREELSRYAATMTREGGIVQDGIQETFLRYFIARVAGQEIVNPRAWLFRVLKNYMIDCSRRSSFLSTANLEEALQIEDSRQDVESGYELSECFAQALSSLSPREQECMQMRLEGFDYNEIAEAMQIQPGTVGALLARGIKKIRQDGGASEK